MQKTRSPRQQSLPAVGAQRAARQRARHQQIERQWRLLVRLANWRRGVTLSSLTEATVDLGARPVSTRTVRRDLDALMGAGFLIEKCRDDGGPFWKLEDQGRAVVSKLATAHAS